MSSVWVLVIRDALFIVSKNSIVCGRCVREFYSDAHLYKPNDKTTRPRALAQVIGTLIKTISSIVFSRPSEVEVLGS